MRCPSCGGSNPEESNQCRACGEVLEDNTKARPADRSLSSSPPASDAVLRDATSKGQDDSPTPSTLSGDGNGGFSFAPGHSLGSRYTLIDFLGKGGMGVVYKAHDRELDRTVALKLIRQDMSNKPDMLARFRRELTLAQLVTHPNVCRVHDLGRAENIYYLSMEFLEGHNLANLISEVGRLSPRQALDIADQVGAGLEAIHEQGIVHRDLKPSNIGVMPSGRAVVMDFGIARRDLDLELTGPGMMVGSASYLAPEQIPGGKVDERTDIYCLGLVLYEMLTGRRPPGDEDSTPLAFRGKDARCSPPSRHNAEVRPELDDLVMRCLEWSPEHRPSSVPEVRAAIRQCREKIGRGETGPKAKPSRYPGAARRLRWAYAALVLVAAAAVVYLFWPSKPGPSPEDSTPSARPIAVLPFEFEGDGQEYSYLADLTTEAFMAGLQSVPNISVPPYETIGSYASSGRLKDRPVSEITRELGVDEVVQGKVSVVKERYVVDLWLSTADGENVWETTQEGTVTLPLLTLESAKEALLQYLHIASEPSSPPLSQIRTPSVEAYQTYLQARENYDRWDIEEHLEQAASLFRRAIELDPDFAAAHAFLARVLVTQFYQNYDSALVAESAREVELASTLAPDLPEVLIAKAFVEELQGNTVETEMAYKRAIELAPGNDAAYRNLAIFYADLGRHDDAQAAYQKAVGLRPGLWNNHYFYGRYLRIFVGDIENARQHLEKAAEYHPSGVGPKTELGNLYLSRGNLEEAETWYRRALEYRQTPWSHFNLGVVYYYRGEYELALRNFQAALERYPNRPSFEVATGDALQHLGQIEQAQRYYGRALETYRRVLEEAPHESENRSDLAALLATLERCEEALQELETVLTQDPDSPIFASEGAYTAILCGDFDNATRLAIRAIRGGEYLYARFEPALAPLRLVPEVRKALEEAGLPLP